MDLNKKTAKIAYISLLTALALIFSYVEVLIPFFPSIPGIKLGIANLVIIVSLYYLGPKYALTINILRVILAGLLFTGIFGALYSLAGALLSFLTMIILKKTRIFSPIGVSIAGGVAHNFGQVLIASIIVSNASVFVYFYPLIISGVLFGGLIGIIATLILKRLKKEL